MSKNAIITWASGKNFINNIGVDIFLKSLRHNFEGDILVFSHDMHQKEKFEKYNCNIINVNPENIETVVRDRFYGYLEHMDIWEKYEKVLVVDIKDVLFQINPFSLDFGDLALCAEGGNHWQSTFNCLDQTKFQMNISRFSRQFMNWPIINAGVIYGDPKSVASILNTIWLCAISSTNSSDQAALNYIANATPLKFTCVLPQKLPYCATGEGISKNWIDVDFFQGQVLFKGYSNPLPYTMIHQWERTVFKNELIEKWIKM